MIQEVEAKTWHAGQICRALRADQKALLDNGEVTTHRDLRSWLDGSVFARSWLLDGRLIAMAGITGTMSSSEGVVWLALTDEATRHPVIVGRRARKFMADAMQVKRRLVAFVLLDDPRSVQFAYFLGFLTDSHAWAKGFEGKIMSYRKAA